MSFRNVPPLRALRAFEASAKHSSFTKAAEELFVTQAAVSLQIKQLEQLLGVVLFQRNARGLELTAEGQLYLADVRSALTILQEATDKISRRSRHGLLTVSVLPSFASKWLVPRLGQFQQAHPDIDVRIAAFDRLVDFERDQVDLAIRYGRGEWPGTHAELLLKEDVFPVCSPKLLKQDKPLKQPEDLANFPLLHDDFSREDWRMWLMAAGVEGVDPERGPSFSHTSILLEAAASGAGIALGRTPLVRRDLESGRLVRPFDISLPSEYAYYVVTPLATAEEPVNVLFRDWLMRQANADDTVKSVDDTKA